MLRQVVPICWIVTVFATFLFLSVSIVLGLLLARGTLNAVSRSIGITEPVVIRWHPVAFGAMLFWSWYFAPLLAAN
jgi:hypothetical protein